MSLVQVPSVLGVLTHSKSDIHLSHVQKFSTCFTDNDLNYGCHIKAVQEHNGQKLSNCFTRCTVSVTDVVLGQVRKVMGTNAVSVAQSTEFPLNVPY
jgi:hypothetical protein